MRKFERKSKYAVLSIVSNTLLIIFKIVAGILSGSVSIISEAIHSLMDLIASIVAFVSVLNSAKPADANHPYGHGKIENISGIAEGVLIFIAAGMIIVEAVKKVLAPSDIEHASIAVAVMLVSAIVNLLVSRKLYQVSREEDSMALEADALHLKTDVYTSCGVAGGILLIQATGFMVLDSMVAILVALMIIKESWELCKNAFDNLIDGRLSAEEEAAVVKVIEKVMGAHADSLLDYHKLKTRKSGSKKHIDFHITLDSKLSVREAHTIVGCLKKELNEQLIHTRVNIHIDPSCERTPDSREETIG